MNTQTMWTPRMAHGNIAHYHEDGRVLVAGDGVKLQAGSNLARQWKARWNATTVDAKKDEGAVWFVAAKWFFRWTDDAFQVCGWRKFADEASAEAAIAKEPQTVILPVAKLDHVENTFAYLIDDRAAYDQCQNEASWIVDAINGLVNGKTPRSEKMLQRLKDAGYDTSVAW